jgi:hypothetical protein
MELYLHTEENERERVLRSERTPANTYWGGIKKLSQSDLSNRNCGNCGEHTYIKISQSDISNINNCLELASE